MSQGISKLAHGVAQEHQTGKICVRAARTLPIRRAEPMVVGKDQKKKDETGLEAYLETPEQGINVLVDGRGFQDHRNS